MVDAGGAVDDLGTDGVGLRVKAEAASQCQGNRFDAEFLGKAVQAVGAGRIGDHRRIQCGLQYARTGTLAFCAGQLGDGHPCVQDF